MEYGGTGAGERRPAVRGEAHGPKLGFAQFIAEYNLKADANIRDNICSTTSDLTQCGTSEGGKIRQ